MTAIRPVLLLAALALIQVAQASIMKCVVCGGTDGACPLDAPTPKSQNCPENTKYCIVEAAYKSTADTLPASPVITSSTARPSGSSTRGPGGSSTAKPGGMQLHYTRKCGKAGMTKPAGYKKEGDLYCIESKFKKECYCKEDNCNKKNPTPPGKGDAASNAAKLSMVVAMGLLAYVL